MLLRFIFAVLVVMTVLIGGVLLFSPAPPTLLFETSFFLLFVTVIVILYLRRVANPGDFVRLYLAMIVLKLMAGLGYAVVMILRDKTGAPANVLYFLTAYIVLTGLEVGFLYRNKSK